MTTVERCLDPAAVQQALQGVLPAVGAVRIVASRRNASRHRNPHPLTLRYEVDVAGTPRGFYGKVFRDGASALADPGAPVLHVASLDLLLWPWPADPGLAQLPTLLDPAVTRPWWHQNAARIDALRYEPEQRATLRYTAADGRTLFAKTFSDGRGEAIHRRFEHFWQLARHDRGAPQVAEPLAYTPHTRTLWQAPATGQPLVTLLPNDRLAAACAEALAALHAAPLELAGPQPRDRAHWLGEVRRRQQKITRSAPELAGRLARVADAIEAAAAALVPTSLGLIHGDCHPDQLWVDGERVVLFDFDEFTLGDPMEDLAAFVVKLDMRSDGARFAAQLLASYAQAAPGRFHQHALRWHLAVQQLLQASRAFVFQVPGWRDELASRLARTEALVLHERMELPS